MSPTKGALQGPPAESQHPEAANRMLHSTRKDIDNYNFTTDCQTCRLHSLCQHTFSQEEHHTEFCHTRTYHHMREAQDQKVITDDAQDKSGTSFEAMHTTMKIRALMLAEQY